MVVSDKIEAAKNCFNTIKTSGRNNFQKYDYLETKDIFPIVRKVCEDFKMKTNIKPDFELNCFVLTITDKEDNSSEQFFVPYAPISAGDAGKFMQDFGRCQTYAMRYLYIQAFEIAVPDEIDNKDQRKKVVSKPKKVVKPVMSAPKNLAESKVDKVKEPVTEEEPTEELVMEKLDECYHLIVEEAGKPFNEASALWQLKRLCKNKPLLLEACKKSLKLYTADKVKAE